MQGKLLIGAMALIFGSTGALAAESIRRQPCPKVEQQQQNQRQQQAQQRSERAKPQGCAVQRSIPPAVDPTPSFLL